MTTQPQTVPVPVPGFGPAVLTLPQPLTIESLRRLEDGLAGTLGELRRELRGAATDPGVIEYASWMRQLRSSRP